MVGIGEVGLQYEIALHYWRKESGIGQVDPPISVDNPRENSVLLVWYQGIHELCDGMHGMWRCVIDLILRNSPLPRVCCNMHEGLDCESFFLYSIWLRYWKLMKLLALLANSELKSWAKKATTELTFCVKSNI